MSENSRNKLPTKTEIKSPVSNYNPVAALKVESNV
jgi:hypothetical protein